MDETLWKIIDSEREQDERDYSIAELEPVAVLSDEGAGRIEIYVDGSWATKFDGRVV